MQMLKPMRFGRGALGILTVPETTGVFQPGKQWLKVNPWRATTVKRGSFFVPCSASTVAIHIGQVNGLAHGRLWVRPPIRHHFSILLYRSHVRG